MSNAHAEEPPAKVAATLASPVKSHPAFRLLIGCYVVISIVFGGIAIANSILPGKSMKDYWVWLETGQRMFHGQPIYPASGEKFDFMYPPTAAALLAPVSALGRVGIVIALATITALAWLASVRLAVRLAAPHERSRNLLLYALPSLIVIVFVWSNFHIGQPSLVILALLLGAFAALQVKRETLAGALVAIAAGIKAFPFIAILYLLYRRYWIAAASMIVSLALLVLVLPAVFRGFGNAIADLQTWASGMLFKYDESGVAQRPGRSNSWKNQSIFGLANRTLRRVDADAQFKAHTPVYVNVADLGFKTVNRIIIAIGLLLGLVYLAVMPRHGARTGESDGIEFALFILLMLMFTPLSFGYLFVSLLYPFTVLIARLLVRPEWRLLISGGMAVLLLLISIPMQIRAQMYGNYFFASLSLFIGLATELWMLKRRAAPALQPTAR
ncbi:MAG: glycosyltransferase family 87 protein [Chthoniobacterales bacterium]